ncbi:MAG: hypothetical protein WBG41_05285 [Acidimicrobiales bacterium]
MRLPSRWLATLGVVGAMGVGMTVGLVATTRASSAATGHAVSPATTVSFNFNATVSRAGPSALTITGAGVADFSHDAFSLSANLPAAVAKLIPGGSDAPESINAVLSGQTIYLEIPGLSSMVGEPWISIALPSTAALGVNGALAKVAAALDDVNAIVNLARTHHATVSPLGTAKVDGVQATGTKIAVSAARHAGNRTITATVWADSADRLVQGTLSSSGSAAGAAGHAGLGLSATVNVSGYGSPVTITVPPPSETTSIPFSVIEGLLGKFAHHSGKHASGAHPSSWATASHAANWSHSVSWSPRSDGQTF